MKKKRKLQQRQRQLKRKRQLQRKKPQRPSVKQPRRRKQLLQLQGVEVPRKLRLKTEILKRFLLEGSTRGFRLLIPKFRSSAMTCDKCPCALCDVLLPQIFDAGSMRADESVIDQLSAVAAYDGNLQLQRVTSQESILASTPASSSSSKTGTLELPPSDATSGQGGRYSGQINSAGATALQRRCCR